MRSPRPISSRPRPSRHLASAALAAGLIAQGVSAASVNQFAVIGSTGASAQQLFLGSENAVYIVDKVENNPAQVNGHPAWATEYDLRTNTFRPMDVRTNSFCAAGAVLGNGTWINVGGNKPVTTDGVSVTDGGTGPYQSYDGRNSTRLLDPCTDQTCQWIDDTRNYMTGERWYPTVETLQDGSAIIIGGDTLGGFVNSAAQNNPTIEFFPHKSANEPIFLPILNRTLPANLYSLTWLLPSGKLLIQTNQGTELYDWENNVESPLPDVPKAIRTYPASGATAMLPLTPANNWTATVMFCGGQSLPDNSYWYMPTSYWLQKTADTSCVKITPDKSSEWEDDDDLPEGRSMGNLIALPDGRYFLTNGINKGVAGYNDSTGTPYGGTPYGNDAIMAPVIYNPSAPSGKRWSRDGLGNLTFGRYYHSSATLLPDGSVFIAGSNPYSDFVEKDTPDQFTYSQVMAEVFYPDYYNERRPQVTGIPKTIGYGGDYFNLTLSKDDAKNADTTKVVLIRPGFSTHAINFGQRFLELDSTYSKNSDGTATVHVSQLPPNPAVFAPGTAMLFVVSNGVPSNATFVMLGNGKIGTQPVSAAAGLPKGDGTATTAPTGGSGSGGSNGSNNGSNSGAGKLGIGAVAAGFVGVVAALATIV